MDDVTRLHHAVPDRCGEVAGAGRIGEHGNCRFAWNEDADRTLARPDCERGRKAAEKGGVAEALALPEDVHHFTLVNELHRALDDDEQVPRGRPVLEENRLAALVASFLSGSGYCLAIGRLEALEGREAPEEVGAAGCVHALHYSPPIPVVPDPCNKSRVLPAWPHLGHPESGSPSGVIWNSITDGSIGGEG